MAELLFIIGDNTLFSEAGAGRGLMSLGGWLMSLEGVCFGVGVSTKLVNLLFLAIIQEQKFILFYIIWCGGYFARVNGWRSCSGYNIQVYLDQ